MAHLPSSRSYPSTFTRFPKSRNVRRRPRTAVEHKPSASRGSQSRGSPSPPRRSDYERREVSNLEDLKPWDVEPEWKRKERPQPPASSDNAVELVLTVVPKIEAKQVESRTLYEELSPENMSESAHMAYTYGITRAKTTTEKRPKPVRPPSTSTRARLSSAKTVKRTTKRVRPHTSVGAREGPDSGSDTDDMRLRASSELDLFPGGVDIMDDKGWDTDLELEEPAESYDHSGRTLYVEACRKAGVVPASYYLRHMHDPHLHMKHHGLGSQGIKPIAISLVSNTTVTNLDLSDNWLGPSGGTAVMDMLKENCYMTEVNLSDNHCGPSIAIPLRNVMEANTTICKLIMSGNELDDSSAAVLAEAISTNQRIEILDLSHNNFGEMGGIILGPAIAENTALRSLDLSWNCIRRKGAVAVGQGIKHNVFMKKINLSWNGMGNDGAKAIGDGLKANNTLEELDVSNNRLTTEGAVLLGKGLAVNETLRYLKIGKNPMQTAGCYAILAAVVKSPNSAVERVDFTDIIVNKDFKELLQKAQEQLPLLKCEHGPARSQQFRKSRPHPMLKLRTYVERNNLKLIDFFNKFDKDGSMSVTREEFLEGLEGLLKHRVISPNGEEIGINLTEQEVNMLLDELDRDGDGEINYSELLVQYTHEENQSRSISTTSLAAS